MTVFNSVVSTNPADIRSMEVRLRGDQWTPFCAVGFPKLKDAVSEVVDTHFGPGKGGYSRGHGGTRNGRLLPDRARIVDATAQHYNMLS